jgi:hypothetical protein
MEIQVRRSIPFYHEARSAGAWIGSVTHLKLQHAKIRTFTNATVIFLLEISSSNPLSKLSFPYLNSF